MCPANLVFCTSELCYSLLHFLSLINQSHYYYILILFCIGQCEDNAYTTTNSWSNNAQGRLTLVVPSDISQYTIQMVTDIPLTDIQVWFISKSIQIFL